MDSDNNLIFNKLKSQLEWAWEKSPFYREKWEKAGISPDTLKTLSDLSKFPVITKEDLRLSQKLHPPYGDYLCVPKKEVIRIHGTSGTTGTPTIFGISKEDWEKIGEAHARIMSAAGIRPSDTIFIGSPFSLYMGSWGVLKGAEHLGATVLPFGAGISGQTAIAVDLINCLKPTCFYGTPSYALRIAEVAQEKGMNPRDFGFRVMFFSGEPGAGIPSTKKKIRDIFGSSCIDMGSMAEMTPWMTNAECQEENGMHLWQDIVYTEVCDPQTFKPVPYGKEGTPIYTHLERKSQPMIRLLSGDLTYWDNAPCPCGRNYPRLPKGIYGRIDNIVVIRGHNINPAIIEDVIRSIPTIKEFRIIISRERETDEYTVEVEATKEIKDNLSKRLIEAIGLRPKIKIVKDGTLPRTEFKAKRVIDNRV